MPVRLAVTEGTVADCQALPLIEGIEAECLLNWYEINSGDWELTRQP